MTIFKTQRGRERIDEMVTRLTCSSQTQTRSDDRKRGTGAVKLVKTPHQFQQLDTGADKLEEGREGAF